LHAGLVFAYSWNFSIACRPLPTHGNGIVLVLGNYLTLKLGKEWIKMIIISL
jgi:hypothetical protein